jgi:hypothetical protein
LILTLSYFFDINVFHGEVSILWYTLAGPKSPENSNKSYSPSLLLFYLLSFANLSKYFIALFDIFLLLLSAIFYSDLIVAIWCS